MSEKKDIKFVNLHSHSTFSVFDGLGYPSEHMDFVHENGGEALALTDHGHMNGLTYQVVHAKKMQADGKKFRPIYGVEAYFIPSIEEWRQAKKEKEVAMAELKKAKKRIAKENREGDDAHQFDSDALKERYKSILNHRRHILLLAKNKTGLHNLFRLVTKSHQGDYFYRYPRIDLDLLREYSEGIIATSGCLGGYCAVLYWQFIEQGLEVVEEKVREAFDDAIAIFGDDFYGELQWNFIKEQHELNQIIIKVSKEKGVKLLSTADSHYPCPESYQQRELYQRLGWLSDNPPEYLKGPLSESREELECELYPKTGPEMFEMYKKSSAHFGIEYDDDLVIESFEETYRIAFDKIEEFYPDTEVNLPGFICEPENDPSELLFEKCKASLEDMGLHTKPEYVERLREEHEVISERGFSRYFLTMEAICSRASNMMMTGPGRGSAAGSLIAYLLKITQIDPIRWGLLFERFLRKDAKDYPDIDFDVSNAFELKEALALEWGEESVVPITNWNTFKPRSLIKDISKYFGIPFEEVNAVTKVMLDEATPEIKKERDQTSGILDPAPTLEEIEKHSPTLQEFFQKYPDVEKHSKSLALMVRAKSRHAGGVVIADEIGSKMPLIRGASVSKDEKARRVKKGLSEYVLQTPWSEGQNVRHLEPFGFIKFDLLGLTTLELIERCIKNILINSGQEVTGENLKEFYDKFLHPDAINFEDSRVYKNVFWGHNFPGIFQFTNHGAQNFCRESRPLNLIDLATITSIYRPGPLSAGVDKDYVEAKRDGASYENYLVEECTADTYGFLVFQETIAILANKIGKDITMDEANLLRKILTKKGTGKGSLLESIKTRFVEGAVEKGLGEEFAEGMWKKFEFFSGYGFNKSHAVSYASISYQCAWLFTYFRDEWVCAYLDKEQEGTPEDKVEATRLAQKIGYKMGSLGINKSKMENWTVEDNVLFPPLSQVKGLGGKAKEELTKHLPLNTIEEILFNEDIDYRKVKRTLVSSLVKVGALDAIIKEQSLGNRKALATTIETKKYKKVEKFYEALEENSKKIKDYKVSELIGIFEELMGVAPIDSLIPPKVMAKFEKLGLKSISTYQGGSKPCWGVFVKKTKKKTKTGKGYYQLVFLGGSGDKSPVKYWSGKAPSLEEGSLYIMELSYDRRFGLSTQSDLVFRRIG